jgi:hypothetical protein
MKVAPYPADAFYTEKNKGRHRERLDNHVGDSGHCWERDLHAKVVDAGPLAGPAETQNETIALTERVNVKTASRDESLQFFEICSSHSSRHQKDCSSTSLVC